MNVYFWNDVPLNAEAQRLATDQRRPSISTCTKCHAPLVPGGYAWICPVHGNAWLPKINLPATR